MPPFTENVAGLGFRTRGVWTASDLADFSTSVGQVYDGFLANHIHGRMVDEYLRYFEKLVEEIGPELGPFYFDWFRIWRRVHRKLPAARFGLVAAAFPLSAGGISVPSCTDLYSDLALYARPSERIVIDRVRITSPGGISFSGLGELIREIRELIKDLWFRNRQERALGELEVIEKYLSVREQTTRSDIVLPTLPSTERFLAKQIQAGFNGWRRLEIEQKLENVGEHIDERPEQ